MNSPTHQDGSSSVAAIVLKPLKPRSQTMRPWRKGHHRGLLRNLFLCSSSLCSDGAGLLAYYAGPMDAERTPILPPPKVCNASTALSDPRSLPCCSITYWSLSLPPETLDLIADHLHDEPTALTACCPVSESWVTRIRRHLLTISSSPRADPLSNRA